MGAPLLDSLPLISTLKPFEVVVPLQETSMVEVVCGGDGVGAGVGVGVGSGVGVGVGDDSTYILIITMVSESSTAK